MSDHSERKGEKHRKYDSKNAWGVTKQYDLGIALVANEDFVVKCSTRMVQVEWDTDDEEIPLPSVVEIPNEIHKNDITDYLSDIYGFCVRSYSQMRKSL